MLRILAIFLCLAIGPLFGGNPIDTINSLINATQKSLDQQIQLREQIATFTELQKQYLKKKEDTDLLIRVAKAGNAVLEQLEKTHLTYNFDPDFLSELKLFSQVSNKKGIPKP